MPVIVDTCVFSLALRRRMPVSSAQEMELCTRLGGLIEHGQAVLLGPVRQELLSGIREWAPCQRLRLRLRAIPDPGLEMDDFEKAAEANYLCRSQGIAGSSVDFLLCGVSLRRGWPLLTTDRDFQRFARVLPLQLLA